MAELRFRILVIDPDPETGSLLEEIFFEHNLQYEFVKSVEKGLKKVKKEHFDLIISEVVFAEGKKTGVDCIRELREGHSQIPVIIMTEAKNTHLTLQAVNYGLSGSLEKPVDLKVTAETILRAIRHHKSKSVTREENFYQTTNYFKAIIQSTEPSALQLLDKVDNLAALVYPHHAQEFPELRMAIYEGLTNAVEHGNKNLKEKRIYFSMEMKTDRIIVHIKDEGTGFATQKVFSKDGTMQQSRGLRLISHLVDEISFNLQGNEINLLKLLGTSIT